eukprot:376578-Prymnesium_polylepis.1
MSVVDIVVEFFHIDIGINTSVLRSFRLMRVFKLARSWKKLQVILAAINAAIEQLANLFSLLGLLIFISALLGMQIVGGRFTEQQGFEDVPRTNFDSIVNSMFTVFVVVSGENWNDVWTDTKAAVGWYTAPYFILLVVMGNYVVLNLFVAILFDSFNQQQQPTGFAWCEVSASDMNERKAADEPRKPIELSEPDGIGRKLASALQKKTETQDEWDHSGLIKFTEDEWKKFGVKGKTLKWEHFV